MSASDDSIEELRRALSTDARAAAGQIRRMPITLTLGAFWQADGHLLLDGRTRENAELETFSGIGFYARPAPGSNPEAIVAHPGGPENPVIVATRDEDLRLSMAADLPENSAAMFNTQAGVFVMPDGTIEIRSKNGTPVKLAKESELNNLRAFTMQQFSGAGHGHGVSGAATNSTIPIVVPVPPPAASYPGTDVIKGE